ncbi:MAG: DsrE family protein [Nitrososphaerota archaeon]|nr:DsrE family protein [Nitrososphaerota archaeon]
MQDKHALFEMAHFGIVLVNGPYQLQRWETAYNIANTALELSDKVTFFLFMDGVYNLLKTEHFPAMKKVPKDYFSELIKKGAEIYACEVCTNNRGLEEGRNYLDGVRITGAAIVSEMVSKCDRIITL